jgi:hypothetical protein
MIEAFPLILASNFDQSGSKLTSLEERSLILDKSPLCPAK